MLNPFHYVSHNAERTPPGLFAYSRIDFRCVWKNTRITCPNNCIYMQNSLRVSFLHGVLFTCEGGVFPSVFHVRKITLPSSRKHSPSTTPKSLHAKITTECFQPRYSHSGRSGGAFRDTSVKSAVKCSGECCNAPEALPAKRTNTTPPLSPSLSRL